MNMGETDSALGMMTSLDQGAFFAGGVAGGAVSPTRRGAGPEERSGLTAALRLLRPGGRVRDLVGARMSDDRNVMRMLVNLGAYAKIAVLIVLMLID